MGHLGLLSCINGGVLCPCGCFRCHLCNSWYSLWFSCCHHGHSKNLAEALPYPHQEGAYKGSNFFIFFLLSFTKVVIPQCYIECPCCFIFLLNKIICLKWFSYFLYLILSISHTFIVINIFTGIYSRGSWWLLFPTKVGPRT